jgi:hypothetical protein
VSGFQGLFVAPQSIDAYANRDKYVARGPQMPTRLFKNADLATCLHSSSTSLLRRPSWHVMRLSCVGRARALSASCPLFPLFFLAFVFFASFIVEVHDSGQSFASPLFQPGPCPPASLSERKLEIKSLDCIELRVARQKKAVGSHPAFTVHCQFDVTSQRSPEIPAA